MVGMKRESLVATIILSTLKNRYRDCTASQKANRKRTIKQYFKASEIEGGVSYDN